MQMNARGTGMSLSGVALLAACACGASSRMAQIGNSFGMSQNLASVHSIFVAFGGALIVGGLWWRGRLAASIGALAVGLLMLGEFLAPPMSVHAGHSLSTAQILGFLATVLAAVGLVTAFYKAYPSQDPRAAVTAMSGAVMAVGCNCCLVTMALAAPAKVFLPSMPWAGATLTYYLIAAALMAVGLGRLGGFKPVAMAVMGQAFVYFWLELPYSSLPAFTLLAVDANFLIKFPMMFLGALIVMNAFVLAYRSHEERAYSLPFRTQPSFGD